MKISIRTLCCGSLAAVILGAIAETKRSPEQSAVQALRGGIRLFQTAHDGQIPTNWVQLGEWVDLTGINESLTSNSLEPIQRMYGFVGSSVLVPDPAGGTILVIRTEPLANESLGLGRYLISNDTNSLGYRWLSEEKVQAAFARAGVPLPQPETMAVQQAEESLKRVVEEQKALEKAAGDLALEISQAESGKLRDSGPSLRAPQTRPPRRTEPSPEAVASSPSKALTVSLFKWIGIGLAGVIGLGLVIVLYRCSK